ncbi:ROK family transcriptional regulator [Breznakiella homolactica]|uniref:ROK family transcriptional regulator n=1 Tax=Breznakiella homolactica TaxID=2798577 RepID=A0A7T7XNS6_9SPIR|nr:ROK family transcriptional regulator [Breznakiella homolactica]QQO09745.1 ROK family transcriptional regulator [Breznakiella homolactica]
MIDIGLPPYVEGMTGDKSLSKAVNRGILLDLLRREGEISRAALAKKSGLNKATVSSQVAELIEMGVARETGTGVSDLGRKPVMLEIDGNAGYALGISINSESLHIISMNLSGKIILDELQEIKDSSPGTVIRHIGRVIKSAEKKIGESRFGLFGLGIAVPGVVARNNDHVVRSAKLNWRDVSLKDAVAGKFGGILHIGNDSTLATIAERELYAPDADDLICVLIDEGIGSGAYFNGTVQYGHNGKFGEVGHMTIMHNGPRCPCGNIGCWDLFGTEMALRQNLAKAGDGKLPSLAALLDLAREIPGWSRDIFFDFIEYLTTGVVSLINAFSPAVVIINSDVLNVSPPLFERLKTEVADRVMTKSPECEIRVSTLGKAAPAMGACIAVTERFFHGLVVK